MATVVAFHAHPDDEVVLTGGTLARASAAGHRVVVVTATDGRVHNEDDNRLGELRSSASILGAQRVECLGYADSGYGPLFYPRSARAHPIRAGGPRRGGGAAGHHPSR